jgi:PAS domain S-box-containing protein
MDPAIRVLFVDSTPDRRDAAVEALQTESDRIQTVSVDSIAAARDSLAEQPVDCVVAAATLSDGTGLDLLAAVTAADESLPFLLLSDDTADLSAAFEAGVTDVVPHVEGAYNVLAERIESHAECRSTDSTDDTARRQYQAFIDNVPGIVYRSSADTDTPFESAYGRCEGVSGYTSEQLETDVNWAADVVHPEDQQAAKREVTAAVERGDRFEVTYRIRTQDGTTRWVTDRGWEVDTTDGIIEGLIIDVSDRVEREQELQREHQRFSDLFSNFPEPTVAYGLEDGTTVFRQVNAAFEALFGLEEDDIRGEPVNELLVPGEQQTESQQIDQQVETGEMVDRVVTRLADDGPRIFNLRSIPVDTGGEIDGFAVYSDITERRQRQRELERYETIVETMPMGIFVVDEETRIVNVNEPGAAILGYPVEEVQGEAFSRFVDDGVVTEAVVEQYRQTIKELRSELSTKEKEIIEAEVTTLAGESRTLEVHMSLLPTDDGFGGSVQVFHDITERKENQRERRRQNERLEEFANIVSHDLRNPLNVAKGHLDLATREYESESLDTVESALERMETLISETLALARQGEMVTDTQPVDLGDIVEGCWEMVQTGDASLHLRESITIQGDPERIKQLLENLFRNAIDHVGTDVSITVGRLPDGFYVADDGPGIPPEERDDVFEAGYTTSENGTGFGLPIVKTIVEAHNWSITITDSADGGARFEITDVTVDD